MSYDRSGKRSHVGRGRRHRPRGDAELEVDAEVELIRSLVGLMHIEELLDEEVPRWLANATPASVGGRRHGSNP